MKRISAVVCLAVALFALSGSGSAMHRVAFADGEHPPGRANACARHARQHGNGYAYGLQCAAPSITTSVSYTSYGNIPLITVSGTHFTPNSQVTVTVTSQSTTFRCGVTFRYPTDSTGSFTSSPIQFGSIRQPSCLPATITVTDAAGNSATAVVGS